MKKKRTHTRKQRAIRWLTALLAILLLGHCTGSYHLLPSHAIAIAEQEQALDHTKILHSEWDPNGKRLYLSRTGPYILFTAAAFSLYGLGGWYPSSHNDLILDVTDPMQQRAIWTSRNDGSYSVYLFGFIPDGASAPTYTFGWGTQADEELDDLGFCQFVDEPLTVTPEARIPTEGGMCYLEVCTLPERPNTDSWCLVAELQNGRLTQPSISSFSS